MKVKHIIMIGFALLLAHPFALQAQIPKTLAYQGIVTDAAGEIKPDGSYSFTFRLYDASSGGTALWTESKTLTVKDGLFYTALGDQVVFPASLVFDQPYWLGIRVGSEAELSPRVPLTSVGYSFRALRADTAQVATSALAAIDLADGAVTSVKIQDGAVTPVKINTTGASSGQALIFNGSNLNWQTPTGGGLTLPYSGTNIAADNAFKIINNGSGDALNIVNNGSNPAIRITNSSSSHKGIILNNYSNNDALSINNTGTEEALSIVNTGANELADFRITNSSNNQEVIFALTNGTGVAGWFQISNSSNSSPALLAYTTGTGYAAELDGDVKVWGNLSKGGGSFQIDHPLDPENKYLYHSFVESPDMMNVYNGNIILNNNGEAIVELPEWFDALNKDFRYQLTCIGGYAPVYIAEKIYDNRFKIAGGTEGLEVSWQVTGIRQDPYANQNRIQVEVEKTDEEKGHYLYYEEYNQPIEKSIKAVKHPELLEELYKNK